MLDSRLQIEIVNTTVGDASISTYIEGNLKAKIDEKDDLVFDGTIGASGSSLKIFGKRYGIYKSLFGLDNLVDLSQITLNGQVETTCAISKMQMNALGIFGTNCYI